jgi:hypothetical protein
MNRLELQDKIIEEGKRLNITFTEIRIYDRGDHLDFYPTIQNNTADGWVYKHQVKALISDLAPIERPHEIKQIDLNRKCDFFNIDDEVEIDDIWIRLDAGEKEPKDFIKIGSCCGQYRKGWTKGVVFETPMENDRALGIKFTRDIYIADEKCGYFGSVQNLEQYIKEDKIKKIEAGQPIWCGHCTWTIRKP